MSLAGHIAEQVCSRIAEVVLASRDGTPNPRQVVDMVFDAFDQQGAGALATWMVVSGNRSALDPVVDAIHILIDKIGEGHDDKQMHEDTLVLVLMAMGDALLGAPMAKSLGLPRETAREIAMKQMMASPRLAARLGLVPN